MKNEIVIQTNRYNDRAMIRIGAAAYYNVTKSSIARLRRVLAARNYSVVARDISRHVATIFYKLP